MLAFFFSDVKLHEVRTDLADAHYFWVLPIFVTEIAAIFLRSYRWKYFFGRGKAVGYWPLFSATAIGLLANNILPAGMGQVVRAYVLAKKRNIPGSTALATIVTERVFDIVSILMLFGLFAFCNTFFVESQLIIPRGLVAAGWISLGLSSCLLGLLVMLRFRRDVLTDVLRRLLRDLPTSFRERITGTMETFADGLEILGDLRSIFMSFFLSMAMWALFSVADYALFLAFSMPAFISGAVFLLIVSTIARSIPSGPGGIGTFDAGSKKGLQILGLAQGAEAFTLVLHACSYVSVTAVGLIALAAEGMSLKELKRERKTVEESRVDRQS